MEEQKTELKMIRMSEVQSQEVKWLWYPFIPYGKLTIIQGDPRADHCMDSDWTDQSWQGQYGSDACTFCTDAGAF